MAKRKAYVHLLNEATKEKIEVFEHKEDLQDKKKKLRWVRVSDALIDEKGDKHYFAIGTEPRTIPYNALVWKQTDKERELFSNISCEKLQDYHNYQGIIALRKATKRPFMEVFSWILAGCFFGVLITILLRAGGLL